MFESRHTWIRRRFGDLDEGILGNLADVGEIVWPDIVREYEVEGSLLTYRLISDIERSAERVAEIFRNGADEMVGNSEIDWHHHPETIIERVGSGDWNFYGCYAGEELIAAESMHAVRGDAMMEWVWGCVDPVHRGQGAMRNMGAFNDLVVGLSGAQIGAVWVVTTHPYSQMVAEQAGYVPMGCFIGKRLYGGSDGRYYRSTLILYAKLYGPGSEHLQSWESMRLTDKAAEVVGLIRGLWEEAGVQTERTRYRRDMA